MHLMLHIPIHMEFGCVHNMGTSTLQLRVWAHRLKSALTAAGIYATHYSGHLFQIGAATTAAANGVSNVTIQTLGWWASDAPSCSMFTCPSRHSLSCQRHCGNDLRSLATVTVTFVYSQTCSNCMVKPCLVELFRQVRIMQV